LELAGGAVTLTSGRCLLHLPASAGRLSVYGAVCVVSKRVALCAACGRARSLSFMARLTSHMPSMCVEDVLPSWQVCHTSGTCVGVCNNCLFSVL
jgi:hypothetical protein